MNKIFMVLIISSMFKLIIAMERKPFTPAEKEKYVAESAQLLNAAEKSKDPAIIQKALDRLRIFEENIQKEEPLQSGTQNKLQYFVILIGIQDRIEHFLAKLKQLQPDAAAAASTPSQRHK